VSRLAEIRDGAKYGKSNLAIEGKTTWQSAASVVEARVDVPRPTESDIPPVQTGAGLAQNAAERKTVPKRIVEADDDDDEDAKVATLEPAEVRPEVPRATKPTKTPTPELTKSLSAGAEAYSPQSAAERTSVRGISPGPIAERSTPDRTPTVRNAHGRTKGRSRSSAAIDVHEAKPTASGGRSLIRALGLKIGKIVIDPGHGGHDTGTIGPNGLEEKNLVLDVAKRLGKLLASGLGAEVIYTRQDDTFIPLETRTAIANQEQADLFISIHANSSDDPDARGVETYYLNFTSSPEALEVAARENAVSEKSIHELQDLVKKIALKEKIEESREFAGDVQHSLHTGLATRSPGIRDRGVKKAPFVVLIGANMPSILAEISFVSNPGDARRLQTSQYRQRIAESLSRGVVKYIGGLGGVKVASRMGKGEGQ
jgi:N-acetylmuramoyl-L-alanine amidase